LQTLQEVELVEKELGRGKYRRRRERRPLVGMLLHLDASTHEWLAGLGMRDLVIALDDADGRILQGRLPQELRLAGITSYPQANAYPKQLFIPDFNRRFTVAPAQPQSAFIPMARIDLELPLSAKHERVVRNDNTVTFKNLVLQLPTTPQRMHFARCPVGGSSISQRHAGGQLPGPPDSRSTMPTRLACPSPRIIRSAPAVRSNARPAQKPVGDRHSAGSGGAVHRADALSRRRETSGRRSLAV
jgi:hypothetical protein